MSGKFVCRSEKAIFDQQSDLSRIREQQRK
jgi:hypothetical protein